MHKGRVALRYAWASPATGVGLVLAAIAGAFGAKFAVVDGVIEVAVDGLERVLARAPRPARFDAITFGHVVIGTSAATLAACRAHERVHVRQYERFGLLFFPLYLGASLVELLRGRHPYWHNPFEQQAFRAGSGNDRASGDRPA